MITSRNYDYLLGGKDNYEADRAAVDAVLKIAPEMGFTARENRAFLGRVVRYLAAEAGIRQFLDIGTILGQAGRLLDFTKPVAVTMLMILHVIPDTDDPYAKVAAVMDALAPGSYLAVSHLGAELLDTAKKQGFDDVVRRHAQQQYIGRSRAEMARFFAGTDLVEPGLVRVEEWRPAPDAHAETTSTLWCGLGRKR